MQLELYQVDAFASEVFRGNPAAVCPLQSWLPDDVMQSIAMENNLSETVFFVPEGDGYRIRWFTPVAEVDLCGHATLAAAFVVLTRDRFPNKTDVRFESKSGPLGVSRVEGDLLALDFPACPGEPCEAPPRLVESLGLTPSEVFVAERDYLAIVESETQVAALKPDFARMLELDRLGVIVSAPGDSVDFVSRFFAPFFEVPEDPVTGSAHCTLTPYWARRLGKTKLHARQISRRGGELFCEELGDRIRIAGRAVLFMEGVIRL